MTCAARTTTTTEGTVPIRKFEDLWNLYRESNFLSPAKIERLGGHAQGAHDAFLASLSLDGDYRVCSEIRDNKVAASCTFAAFSDAEFWVMHLASRNDRFALAGVFRQLREAVALTSPPWATFRFRLENRSVQKFFTGGAAPSDLSLRQYFEGAAGGPESATGFSIRPVANDLLPEIQRPARDRWEQTILGRREYGIARVKAAYAALGLPRDRVAIEVLCDDGRRCLVCILDLAADGWNLSGLASTVELFPVKGQSLSSDGILAVLNYASSWYAARGATRWLISCDAADARFVEGLAALGLHKRNVYGEIGAPAARAATLIRAYAQRVAFGAAR